MQDQIALRKVADSTDKDKWLEARLSGVTASDAANLVDGVAIHSLVYKKLNNTFKGNKWTDWGLEREPFLMEWAGFEGNSTLFRSLEEPRFMATPDGIKIANGEVHLCQAKTTSKYWDAIPDNYIRQCQWEMFVMGAQTNLLVWEQHQDFIPVDLEPKKFLIERDDNQIAKMLELAQEFLVELDKQKEGI